MEGDRYLSRYVVINAFIYDKKVSKIVLAVGPLNSP
jgi:hypothetical protein